MNEKSSLFSIVRTDSCQILDLINHQNHTWADLIPDYWNPMRLFTGKTLLICFLDWNIKLPLIWLSSTLSLSVPSCLNILVPASLSSCSTSSVHGMLIVFTDFLIWPQWTSCQIHKIAGYACAENAVNVFLGLAIPICIVARACRDR